MSERRQMHVEPLEDRSMLAVLAVDPSNAADYATIGAAVAAAHSGDTVQVVAGTFSESVAINKPLTIEGAQHGVDARSRSGAETIVTGAGDNGKTPFYVTANDVTIDGFKIEGATNPNQFGFGVLVGAGTSGAHVENDIIDGNIAGLSLANANAADPAVVQHNLFLNNNQPGPASGAGIYSDQFNAGGTLAGALIDGNVFQGNSDSGINFSSTDATKPATGITVSNNDFNGNGRGLVAFNLTNSSIDSNTFRNSTSSATADIRLFEGDNGLSISDNLLENGAGKVFRVSNAGTGSPDATNIKFNGNSISGYTGPASLFEVDNYNGKLDARQNWWGTNNANTIDAMISNPAVVAFSPYLDNGTNGASGTGFRGDFSHLDATSLGAQIGTPGPIEAAILAAAPGATVNINAGTYSESDIVIDKALTLVANGAVTIQSPTTGSGTGVTVNAAGRTVSIQGFTISGFSTGVLVSAGNVSLSDSTVSGNTGGSGIFNEAVLTVTNCTVTGNSDVASGGGLYNDFGATLTVTGSTISGNTALDGTEGGGIYNDGTLNVSDSTISGNTAAAPNGLGGGITNEIDGTALIVGCTISGNTAAGGGFGGGLYNDGKLAVTDSTVSGNSAELGGGIYSVAGTLTLSDSTIFANSATDGGGLYNTDAEQRTGNGQFINDEGVLNVTDSTIAGNSAASGQGGGIDSVGGVLTVSSSTISGNSALTGGGIHVQSDPYTIQPDPPTASLANSIVAGNSVSGAGASDSDVGGAFAATDHDLIGVLGDATGFATSGPTASIVLGSDAAGAVKLAALANNGGPTQTMALLAGSAALDAGDNSPASPPFAVPAVDQRGLPRIVNGAIDIGAFEVQTLSVTATQGGNYTIRVVGGQSELLDGLGNVLAAWSPGDSVRVAFSNASGAPVALTVDFSNGNPIPAGGLSFDGGSGNASTMLLMGGGFGSEVYTPSSPHAGTVKLDSSTITYAGLAPIQDTNNAASITINGTAAGEQINVVNGPVVGGFQTTEVNSGASGTFEKVDFANKTTAIVNGAGGADTVVVDNPNVGAGLTSLALTVNGAGSAVAVDAAGTPVSVDNLAAGSATASVTVGNGTLGGITGDVTVSGAAGSTALVIDDHSDSVLRSVTVASSQTSGLAASGAAVNYTAADLSSLMIDGGTNNDAYAVTSTPAGAANAINAGGGNNVFNITGGGLGTGSTNSFTSLGGDDTFNVSGPLNASASINAGSQATADVLNYDAGGQSVVLTANSITAGAGQTLTFSNIEHVKITNVAGVTVDGDNNANNLILSQTGAATDAYTLDGGPLVTFTGATSFAFNGLGGADSLAVDNSGGLIDIPISFAGGAGFDSLFVSGNAGPGVSAVYSQTGSDATGFAGSIVYTGAVTEAINFTGLSPVETLTPVTSLTINDAPGAAVENIVTGPTSTGVDPLLATTATTYQVNYGGAGEPIHWRNATTVTVNASSNSDTITENLPTRVDAGSPNQLTTLDINAGSSPDEIDILATPAGVVTNTDTQNGVPDRTVIGGTFANFNNATGSTAAILGAVHVSDSGGVGELYVDDSGGAGPDVVTLTNSSIVGAAPVTIGYEPGITALQLALTAKADTVNVQSTNSHAVTTLFGNGGDDTFNVSSTAPTANGNGALTGNLSGIQGELDIASGAGNDTLNVSDYGGVGRNYTVADLGSGVTQISASGIANIVYNLGGGLQLEHFNLVGASAGGNTYNINSTTATASNVVNDGDASASGNSTFYIQADQLQAGSSNSFHGFAGSDTFNLNFAAGGVIPAGATLFVDGGGLASGNDRVNVNANQAGDGPRTIGLNYQSNATSDVQITGLGAAGGTIGVVGARQINYYGDAANDDVVSVSGAASGNNTLSVTPLSASSANVFLGGHPLLTIPPGSTGSNNPGVAGGGAGPDLFVGGVAPAGFSVNGGSTGAGNGNRLVVNGKSENLNGAGGTSAWGGNAFGSPADTVTAGNGYDRIDVSDSAVSINNNAVGALLTVNYAAGSFANPSPTQAAVTVNGGDESTPAAGVADDFTVHLSPAIHFQINGGAPPAGSAPNGDRLHVDTPNDAEIWSDAATPPNVSITSSGALPVSYNSIEELALTPGNGIVNIYGDNNVSGGAQNDGYRVVGTGPNAFTLQISGDKNNPASYSSPIQISGVTTLNAFGEAKGVENTGNDVNALYVTPWANNTPQGWGVQTFFDQGDKNHDGDLLVYNGVAGVSENINVQPSASEAGQLFSTNSASGTPIAVINYTLNTNIIVNGNDGSAGDTDTLTLNGTDPANPGTSGQDNFVANFAAAGTPADPMVTVTDNGSLPPGAPLYTIQSLSNINTVNVKMQGGSDFFELKSGRSDGSLTVNVDGGAPSGSGNVFNTDAVQIDGTAGTDAFEVSPGATSDAGRVAVQLAGATAPTVLNFTTMENVVLSGGGGSDDVTLDGTGSNDSFVLANGTAQVNSNAPILLSGFGAGSMLNLDGLGGANSFAIDQATGSMFANVIVSGGASGNGSVAISGTNGNDAINFTPISANSGLITVNSGAVTHYILTGITSASIDALGQTTGDSLNVATAGTFVNTPGAQPGSGKVQVTLPGNIATLPLNYANVENVTFSGTTLVINGTSGNDHVVVAADGSVTVNGNPVATAGFNALVLNLYGGTDSVSIAAGANFAGGIIVNGAGQTNVTVTGTAGDDAIGVNAAAGTVTGIVAGPITLIGVQNLTVHGGGAAAGDAISVTNLGMPGGLQSIDIVGNGVAGDTLHVSGSGGPDDMIVTPSGATSGSLQDSGVGPVVNYSSFTASGALQVTANALTVNGSAGNDNIAVTNGRVTVAGDLPVNYNTSAAALNINGLGGNDVLTVDSTTGAVTTPIYYDGGAGSNLLTLTGGTADSDTYSPGTAAGQGLDKLVFGGNTETVHFVNLAPVIDNVAGPLVVNGTNGDDAITVGASPNLVSVNNLETISFANKTGLALYGLAGNDSFAITPSNISIGAGTINVNGGDPTASDKLIVNGTSGADTIDFAPASANSGSVTIAGAPAVNFTTTDSVSINGQGGADRLTVTTPAGADAITYTAGSTIDSASVQVGSFVPMSFSNLGAAGRVTLADSVTPGLDSLLYNGTAGNDSFGVNATGIVFLNGQLPVNIPGIASLTLDGQGGVNTFAVDGNVAIPVNVNGGSAAAGNSLTVLGNNAAPLTIDLGNHTVQETGFGLISFNGVSQVNVDAAGQNINVVGGVGDDSISYTPTGAQAGTLQDAGSNAVFNLTTVGVLSLDPLGGTNTVAVDGSSAANTIDVGRGANTQVQVDSLLAISIVSAHAQALVINSGLGDDTINVTGSTSLTTPSLAINGGSPAASDSLNVTTHGLTSVFFGANSTSGTIGAASDPAIAFSNIEAIALNSATKSGLNFWGTNGNDAINVKENVISLNGAATVAFANYPTLNLFGQSGDDTFNVWPTTLAGVTSVSVDGGDPTASDKLIVNGSSAADAIGYHPTGADAGSVSIAGSPTVNFTTTESVVVNGQGGADTLTYTTPSVSDGILTFTPGATANSGSVSGRLANGAALAPLSFTNIDSSGLLKFAHEGVTLPSGAANDTLVVNGTAGDDIFAVTGASIALEKQATPSPVAIALPIKANSISSLTLSGQGGNDTFDLAGTSNYAGVFVQGSGTVDPSVTNLTGDGTAINVNVGGVSTVVTGGGLGTVTITGNQIVNIDAAGGAAGGAVTATDSAGSNTLDVTPTSGTSATLQIEGQAPVVNISKLLNNASFNVKFTGAGDSLVVNGTTGADTINASGSSVAVNSLLIVSYTGATALTVNGSTGADTFNVTPDAVVPIHVNGGDPIGVLPGDVLNIVAGGSPVSYFAGPHSDEGGFQVGSDAAVSFQQIESIGPISNPGPVLIVGTNGDDDIQVIARDSSYSPLADGVQDYTVSVNAGPNLLFINAPNLYIDAMSGDDEVDVRAPAPNHAAWNTQVVIAGGAPAGQPGLNGDNFTLETPGSGNNVTYQPTAIDGGVFTFNSSTITLTSAPFTIPAINYTSSAGGFEAATYDGQGAGDALTILGTTGNDTITHTAGAANDAGEFAVNSLLPLSYKNLGAGSITVNGNGASSPAGDTLVVDGTANNDAFAVDAVTGTVHLNSRLPIAQTGITNLVLNGYNPNNTFTLNASLPYASTAVNSIDPATLTLNGTAGAEAIGVNLANSTITGFGGTVSFVGVATVNMNGNGGADSLTVNGTTNDDVISYKPTSAGGGTFSLAGLPVNFNFNIGSGNVFTVNGGGGNGGDEVDVVGNNAGSVITVDSPNRTVSVENALNVVLMPVVLGTDVQVASVAGGLGNNTFLVIPARNVPSGNDIVGPGFLMPNNLLVHVNGGAVPANAALVVADTNGATLDSHLFAVVNRTSNTSGVVRLFKSTGGPEPIQFPDISYANVGIVQASTAVNAATHQQQTLTMGPDLSDPNGSLNNAAYLGSGASINATNLTIFPNALEHRFLQAEQDWFRVVAQFTGTMDFQVYFKQYAGFLPGGGELQIQVYDAAGNQIADFGINDSTGDDQRRRIPVVAGETYYLQVYGITQNPAFAPADGFDATNATVNAYSLSITNTPAPKPDSLGLNNIVAQGSVNNAIAPTTTTFAASNAALPPPTQPLPPLSTINNFYVGKYLEFTSGALIGQRQLVTAYAGATQTFTFSSPFSAAPAPGDKFQIESNDTGRSQFDNVTRDNTPTVYIRLDAANTPTDGLLDLQGGGSTSQTPPNNTPILIPFWAGNSATPANNGSFRVAVYDDTNPQSPIFLGYASAVPGQTGVFQLQVATPLAEGSHMLAAKVEIDSPSTPSNKDLSAAATFQMVVDTLAPPVYFGTPTTPNSGLLGSSDTGVSGQPATIVDRITADSTPTLYGVAEANAVVRLYDDANNDGVVDNGDVFLGMATATPTDGTNQMPSGQWQITSSIDLNNPKFGFPLDGVRHLLVTAEDAAGNLSKPQALTIFLDTQGPNVGGVSVTGSPGYNLFLNKPAEPTPTPLVNALDVSFTDKPIRVGPDFVYPAVNPALATTISNYQLVGEHTGPIAITSVTFADSTASGTPGMSVATLHFAGPLPDDRYTLTISDHILDNAGNPLDGEFNGSTFPSGNGSTGGVFGGSFTVNSRPHLGDYSAGSVSLDLNGNGSFDPQNNDAANRDAAFTLGFATDRLFAGKFANAAGTVSGFDKLGAYGFLNGQWRWLLDLDGDGAFNPAAGDLSIVEPLAIDGLPVAGNFDGNPADGDQVGIFDGATWWLDTLNHHMVDAADVAAGGKLTGDMRGLPIVGDFDGDGKVDLGTYSNGVFYFDLSSRDPGGKLTGNYNATINVQSDLPNNIGFAGVLARPVAADMNQDGTTDIGLYVPGRTTDVPSGQAEWFWLISSAPKGSSPTDNFNSLNHPFDPTPLGNDLFYQFGDQFSLPLVGIWDPPTPGSGTQTTQSSNDGWLQNLYLDVLGRSASSDEVAYWSNAVNHGITPSQVATTFLTSTEHRSQLINTLYEQYLGRQADQAGINFWIGVWNATGGPEAVQAGIIGSPEYYAKAGGNDSGWVTALYHNILGRGVDAHGLANWTDYIKTHSKQSVVLGFVTSDEYRLNLINGWFQIYLGRQIDAAGAQFWLNAMKAGMTQEQIQAGILGSEEFLNR